MPYGMDKKLGGDSKDNDAWMERCVTGVMSNNSKLDKSSAVAICKAQFRKSHSKKAEFIYDETITIDPDVEAAFFKFREEWIRKSMLMGKTFNDSYNLFHSYLSLNNFNF